MQAQLRLPTERGFQTSLEMGDFPRPPLTERHTHLRELPGLASWGSKVERSLRDVAQ